MTGTGAFALLLITGYICAAAALIMLFSLYVFLCRIGRGEIFTPENIRILRRIGLCCLSAAAAALFDGLLLYFPFLFIAAAAGFMTLIVRVVQNAFARAQEMKDELDYTV